MKYNEIEPIREKKCRPLANTIEAKPTIRKKMAAKCQTICSFLIMVSAIGRADKSVSV